MKTLVDVMRHRAQERPHSDAFVALGEGGVEAARLTFQELDLGARRVAGCLQSLGLEGERILLLYPPGYEFIVAFLGCLYAGAIAIPAHPPGHARSMKRMTTLVADCSPALALTTDLLKARLQNSVEPAFANLRLIGTETLGPGLEDQWRHREIPPDHVAFLQYTSGSTSSPKGVMVTHRNLMYTEALIQQAFGQTGDSVVVNWLPFYHDMGLIGGLLQPLFSGGRCILMPPMQFLQQPVRWLQAISKYRATTSGGPNFAYDYCAQKITAEQREGLDLSCWKVAFCGSEPVRAATLENFAREFAACGFSEDAFQPCYGLAEATLLVSGFKRNGAPVVRAFCSDRLLQNKAVPAPAGSDRARRLVGSGRVSSGDRVVIVDTGSLQPCAERTIGEIWVSGSAVAEGYWQKPAETSAVFQAKLNSEPGRSFLRTGDSGFLDDGELFITGRLKDLVISRGVNHFPQDIEETVSECHACLQGAAGAAFSLFSERQAERLVIVHEAEKRAGLDYAAIIREIRSAVAGRHDLQPHAIILVRAGTVPKTPSGKVQRHACRDAFLGGSLSEIAGWRHSAPGSGEDSGEDPAGPPPFTAAAFESIEDVRGWLVGELGGLLGVEPASIDSEVAVSQLGLDSLTAVELTHRIEGLGVALPVSLLLETASVSGIASEILAAPIREIPGTSVSAVSAGSRYPLSYGQKALWFLQRLEPGNSAYNLSSAFRVRGPLDRAALRRAFQSLVRRHPAFRTTFDDAEGRPMQRVHEKLECAFTEHDASNRTAGQLDEEIVREMNSGFNPETGPLLRVALYECAGEMPVLQLTVHHTVADFWSLAVALDEVGRLYALESGAVKVLSLPPAPAYADFVQRESELLEGPEGERLWDYWRQRLAGEMPVCALSTDRPRNDSHSNAGGTARIRLGRDLVAELNALAREQGCTLYMVLLAGFYALLFRYSDFDDLLIGSPALGRVSAGFSRLVGYCVNPLPLRVRIDAGWSFSELAAAVRETVSGAFAHQQFPFPLMVEKLHPERTSLRTALFQIIFTFLGKMPGHVEGIVPLAMGEPGSRVRAGDLEFESLAIDDQPLDFDLSLTAGIVDGADVAVALRYQRDLFDSSTVQGMLSHWKALLAGMARDSGRPISDCPFLSADEIAEIISVGEGVRVEWFAERCISGALEDFVRRDPERVAVIFGDEEITQDQVNLRANRLAHHLLKSGAAPDVLIGVCLDRSAEMVITLIAILKTGAAYVPLDPGYPEERLSYMVRDAGIGVVVTTRRRAGLFSAVSAETVCIDDDAGVIAAQSSENLPLTVMPDHIAYIIYTSGSTGRPKGVMVTQRNVMNLFAAMDALYGTEPGVWLAVTSISFDISVVEMFWTLSRGSEVVVSPDRLPIGETKSASLKRKITHLQGTPSTISMLCADPETAAIVASVEKLVLGGEAVTPALLDSLPESDRREIYDQFGPTETTVWATAGKVSAGSREVTIGRPIANTEIYILDRFLNPAPMGVPGEICIAGEGLTRGYLGRPDSTAEKFIPDFPGGRPGARLYRTGDRGRWDRDRNIEFLGRFDNQVKVRGHRIECGEIETCLAAHPWVVEVAVNPVRDSAGEISLAAYIVPGPGPAPSIRQLRDFVGGKLPEYMIPSHFVTLESFPHTPSGKLDRNRLPAAERMELERGEEFVPPGSALERVLAELWAELLNVERVGIHTDFFAAGGHSLLATAFIARLREVFEVELPLQKFFENPTIASLGAAMLSEFGERLERTAEILDTITRLPEEEVEAALREQSGASKF